MGKKRAKVYETERRPLRRSAVSAAELELRRFLERQKQLPLD